MILKRLHEKLIDAWWSSQAVVPPLSSGVGSLHWTHAQDSDLQSVLQIILMWPLSSANSTKNEDDTSHSLLTSHKCSSVYIFIPQILLFINWQNGTLLSLFRDNGVTCTVVRPHYTPRLSMYYVIDNMNIHHMWQSTSRSLLVKKFHPVSHDIIYA